jgi:hypothetical protein
MAMGIGVQGVAKKKLDTPTGKPKRYGTMIRVSDEFAEALRLATGFEQTSVAEFADAHLLPIVKKRYRDAVMKEAKRIEGGER